MLFSKKKHADNNYSKTNQSFSTLLVYTIIIMLLLPKRGTFIQVVVRCYYRCVVFQDLPVLRDPSRML